ncbi:alkaline phosphatase family protein [Terrabacter sp. NPDC000476]|uniref:alkaline phosphatase family protein n=1 Tax=Terrabacter sp. NPDC000476 TaxID=3154258 RepID=UPI0033165720
MSNKVLGWALATAVLLGACGSGAPTAPSAQTSAPATASSAPATSTAIPSTSSTSTSAQPAAVSKLLVFVVENHSLDQMSAAMPYTVALGRKFGAATSYRAVTHPSLPNYLAMTGGSTAGIVDDAPPASHATDQPSVFGQALSVGGTAKLYAEGMPGTCATASSGTYAVRHNPWAYHLGERAACKQFDVPLMQLSTDAAGGQLPNAGMVIPDVCNDAHDCDLATADRWLRTQVEAVMSGPDWRAGRLAIVVTADEDDRHHGNVVLTTVAHPSLHSVVDTTPLDHYSLARLYSEVLGAPPLGQAATATSMASTFNLPLGGG